MGIIKYPSCLLFMMDWIAPQVLALNADEDSPGYASLATLSSLRGKRGLKFQ
jgi:hypothetical protein